MSSVNNAPVSSSPYTQSMLPVQNPSAAARASAAAPASAAGVSGYGSSVSNTTADQASVRGLLSGRGAQQATPAKQDAKSAAPVKKHKSVAAKIRSFFKHAFKVITAPIVTLAKAVTAPMRAGINFLKNLHKGLGLALKASLKTFVSPVVDAAKTLTRGIRSGVNVLKNLHKGLGPALSAGAKTYFEG